MEFAAGLDDEADRARGSSPGPKARKDAGLSRKPGQAKLRSGPAGAW